MSEDKIRMEVVTPEGAVFDGYVSAITAPSTLGSLGILYNHAPLMTSLDIGILEYTKEGKKYKMAVFGGFLEVNENHITVLADVAEMSDSIDKARAERALERARKRLAERDATIDVVRAETAVKRALTRLSI